MTQVPAEKGVNKKGKSATSVPRGRETRASKKQGHKMPRKKSQAKASRNSERARER